MTDTNTIQTNVPVPTAPALATPADIFTRTRQVRKSTSADVETLRDWMFDQTDIFKAHLTQYLTNNEWADDPDIFVERLLKFHQWGASMMGLAEGLYERALYLCYKELTEDSRGAGAAGRQKLTAGDRELYAKGETADLKGLKKDLEETQRNLWERINIYRGNNRRY